MYYNTDYNFDEPIIVYDLKDKNRSRIIAIMPEYLVFKNNKKIIENPFDRVLSNRVGEKFIIDFINECITYLFPDGFRCVSYGSRSILQKILDIRNENNLDTKIIY